jgi:benzoylformate decarboxylase
MTEIAGKHALLELFVQEGIGYIFGNPGSTELHLMDALAGDARIRFVLGLQEACVMGMADGYAQASGELAAVSLHAAPGLGNALGMLYNAKMAGTPLLVTAGQQDLSFALTEPILWDDLAVIARPFVKWSTEITSLADLPRTIHRAAKVALAPPKGPVFLSIPGDILAASAELDLGAPSRVAGLIAGDPAAIEAAARLILEARAPVIFCGDVVAEGDALAEVSALAETIAAPVYAESMPSRASFPSSHPLFAGTVERFGPAARAVLDRHDLIVSLGGDLFTESLATEVEPVPPGMKIVHIDVDPWQLGKNYPTEAAILGHPKRVAPALAAQLSRLGGPEFAARASERFHAVKAALDKKRSGLRGAVRELQHAKPIKPMALIEAIGKALPQDAVVVDETLSSGQRLRELIPAIGAKSYFGMRGGGIGWGLAASVGVKLALAERPVFALTGDGSALYTIQSIWTAANQQIPMSIIVFNNQGYRILKQRILALKGVTARTGRFIGMDLDSPPIDMLALGQAFGAHAVSASEIGEVIAAMKDAQRRPGPTLIDVAVDPAL